MTGEIVTLEGLRAAGVRHQGPYAEIGEAFERLGGIADSAGLLSLSGARMIGVYYDDPLAVPAERLRSDAGLVIDADAAVPEGLAEISIPGGSYAKSLHLGGYDGLGAAWRGLEDWVAKGGRRRAASPSFELYLNTPMNAATDALQTELYIPLA